jgi:hypothetical protein
MPPEPVAAEIHQGTVVFNRFVRRISELTRGMSLLYCLVAGVHYSILQVNSERSRACAAVLMQFMDAPRECVDMLRNFIRIIGGQPAPSVLSRATKTRPVTIQGLANVSPAFEAWLQAYRRRLEQLCERASSQAVSP